MCVAEPELGSPDHIGEVFSRALGSRVPLSGSFDITYRCNYRCVHCYAGHLVSQPAISAGELTTRQVKDLLEQAVDLGCLFLLLSGGEPLLREDFVEIYVTARRLGLIVTVFTNASLLTPAHLDAFREYPPRMVDVSFYGTTAAVYERITGVPGSFERARRGVDQLLESGMRVGLKTMVLSENVEEVPAIEALARKLGTRFRLDPVIVPGLDGDPSPLGYRVDPGRAVEVELASEQRSAEWLGYIERRVEPTASQTNQNGRLYPCGAGMGSYHLDPLGFMRPCLMARDMAYNAAQVGFAEAWKAVTTAVDTFMWEGVNRCGECSSIDLCGYCPGHILLEGASPSHPPEYLCQLGESRRLALSEIQQETRNGRA